jgi:hypothetical protein
MAASSLPRWSSARTTHGRNARQKLVWCERQPFAQGDRGGMVVEADGKQLHCRSEC